MTRKEASIIMAYTGVVIGDFSTFHKYAEALMGRPIFTYELTSKEMKENLKELSKLDFVNLEVVK